MRLPVISVLSAAALLGLLSPTAPADTIRLKNGRTIAAEHAREAGGRLEYEIGDDHYAIPMSLVASVEAGGAPLRAADARRGEAAAADVPVIRSSRPLVTADVEARLIRNGRVDPGVLSAIEASGDARAAAFANDAAGAFEQERGDFERAGAYYRRGLSLAPDTALLQAHYAGLLLKMQRYTEAVPYAERAARLAADSADYLALLGFAYFLADRSRDAIAPWRRSLSLRPDAAVQQHLAKAERELAAEANFGRQESSHFTLRYEGRETSAALRKQILAELEAAFDRFVAEFGVAPRESIPVILYTNEAFFDVTETPRWADAVNDGKLRIPIDRLETMTDELARVLRHELAHTFISFMTRSRAPQWLHEGIAQQQEPRRLAARGRWLAQLAADDRWQPFNTLESSFLELQPGQAALAYGESLAAVEYIRQQYGESDLRRILERIGEGSSTEAALRATIRSGYDGLQQDVAQWVRKTYGQ